MRIARALGMHVRITASRRSFHSVRLPSAMRQNRGISTAQAASHHSRVEFDLPAPRRGNGTGASGTVVKGFGP